MSRFHALTGSEEDGTSRQRRVHICRRDWLVGADTRVADRGATASVPGAIARNVVKPDGSRIDEVLAMRTTVLILTCIGCSGPHPVDYDVRSNKPRELAPDVTNAELAQAVAGNGAFALDLYRQAATSDGNKVLSPYSLSTGLAMTWAGARGDTAAQLATALHFTLSPERQHAAFNALALALATRADGSQDHPLEEDPLPFQLEVANSLWAMDGLRWETPFLDALAVNYDAGLNVENFAAAPDAARATINAWIEARTTGRIPELFASGAITRDTRLVLANAITFSASWDQLFEPSATAARAFFIGESSVDVPTLHRKSTHFRYGEGAGYRAVELPYDGGDLAMLVIEPDDLSAFEATLSSATLAAVIDGLASYDVDLRLPKFRIASPLDLGPHLEALGIVDAFAPTADFTAMTSDERLAIERVVHQSVISVDERGSEAAAASGVVVGPVSQPESVELAIDHPFLFVVRDRPTGTILFIGRVVDPR